MERVVPDDLESSDVTGFDTLKLHLARYEFAAKHLRPGRTLDIACGVGYGAKLLVERGATDVTAVDIDPSAIAYACERYSDPNIRFETADATHYSHPGGFDTIISLETIEHVSDAASFVGHLASLLRPNGVLIGSVPTTPSADVNPHHLHDFTERSFRRIGSSYSLREFASYRQVQHFQLLPMLLRRERRAQQLRGNLAFYYLFHPDSLVRRLVATARFGLTNRYLVLAWTR